MAKTNPDGQSDHATVGEPAPDTVTPAQPTQRYYMPREMEVERIGNMTSGVTFVFPEVRGGICEYCGVIDGNYPSEYQYKLCPHYRGKQLACSYCPSTKNVDDVTKQSVLRVLQHPDNPKKLIIHCNSYECLRAHEQRWKVAVS